MNIEKEYLVANSRSSRNMHIIIWNNTKRGAAETDTAEKQIRLQETYPLNNYE